jgi:hypothetical protein
MTTESTHTRHDATHGQAGHKDKKGTRQTGPLSAGLYKALGAMEQTTINDPAP